jgi:uncharacterized linocin/CFP29 family protein
MSYLSRESSPISSELWQEIDGAVVKTARKSLISRRFLHIFGPLGVGTESIPIDDFETLEEVMKDGLIVTKGRSYKELPTIYDDFTLLSKDMENSSKYGYPVDLSKAVHSAETCARKEDHFILFGNAAYGYEGLMTASGSNKIKKTDWSVGENAYSDIVTGLELFTEKAIYGTYALVVSPDLYMQLQRIQPGTGLLELDRISKIFNGNVFTTPVLGLGKALMVAADSTNMDLVVGQDLATAYLEQKDLNHNFRILESLLLRIKRRQAITIFE